MEYKGKTALITGASSGIGLDYAREFARRIQVVSRAGELGDLAMETAALAGETIRTESLPPVLEQLPWAADLLGSD